MSNFYMYTAQAGDKLILKSEIKVMTQAAPGTVDRALFPDQPTVTILPKGTELTFVNRPYVQNASIAYSFCFIAAKTLADAVMAKMAYGGSLDVKVIDMEKLEEHVGA